MCGSEIHGAKAVPHGNGVGSNGLKDRGTTDAEEQGTACHAQSTCAHPSWLEPQRRLSFIRAAGSLPACVLFRAASRRPVTQCQDDAPQERCARYRNMESWPKRILDTLVNGTDTKKLTKLSFGNAAGPGRPKDNTQFHHSGNIVA